jgi:hypothetical protein
VDPKRQNINTGDPSFRGNVKIASLTTLSINISPRVFKLV